MSFDNVSYETAMQTADRFMHITDEVLNRNRVEDNLSENHGREYLRNMTRWQLYVWAEQLWYQHHMTPINYRNIEHHLHHDTTLTLSDCFRFFIFPDMKKQLKRKIRAVIEKLQIDDPSAMTRTLPTLVPYEPMNGTKYY